MSACLCVDIDTSVYTGNYAHTYFILLRKMIERNDLLTCMYLFPKTWFLVPALSNKENQSSLHKWVTQWIVKNYIILVYIAVPTSEEALDHILV